MAEKFQFLMTGRRKKSHPVKQLLNTCVFAEKPLMDDKSSCLEPSKSLCSYLFLHHNSCWWKEDDKNDIFPLSAIALTLRAKFVPTWKSSSAHIFQDIAIETYDE